ncbi:MAG: ATP-dependent zinc metalloprotease FtsH [Bacteroidetes bacterium]|nr:ATP-dependent zinc metalloprotease FtsH [Bacteroidota bacterium]
MADENNKKPIIPGTNGKLPKPKFNFYWVYILLIGVFLAMTFFNFNSTTKKIEWAEFKVLIEKQYIDKIQAVNKDYARIYIKKDSLKLDRFKDVQNSKGFGTDSPQYTYKFGSYDSFKKDVTDEQVNLKNPVYIENVDEKNWAGDFLSLVFPILLLIVAWFFIMRMMNKGSGGGGQIFNIGKSKAQLFDKDTMVNINFNDVAGLQEAKVEIMEIVDFLKNPKKYTQLGGKIPKGALLVGPPGTGKTLLAKAVAGEAKVPFFSLSGSDFVEMFVGVGASRVRDLFKQAKEKAPCIIFIDEIDAIGRARGRNSFTGGNDERENTLNQLLTEMDGFSSNNGVIILAATNRADILDRALLRAGRFDRQIHVELPDIEERKAIFEVHMRGLKLEGSDTNVEFLAKQTPGFSGADIANVCNEAALIAARKNKEIIEKQDFIDAIDRIVGGLEKRNKIISRHEKEVIAYHESGHAAVSWLLEHGHPLVKVTIVPRGKSLGAAWYLPEERQITTFEQMFDEMTSAMGGRASEEIFFGKISTGALSDLEKVTKQAYSMVVYFGLNDKIGNISYYDSSGQQEYTFTKPYSEKTSEIIDQEIRKLIEAAYDRAKEVIIANREKLESLALQLLKKEVIYREDLEAIFGPRPFEEERLLIENGDAKLEEKAEESELPEIKPVQTLPQAEAPSDHQTENPA